MDNYRIGIDPGGKGAIVVLCNGNPIAWLCMPLMKIGTSTRVNAAAIAYFLYPYKKTPVFIELVHIMPKQGAVSAFTFGESAGVVRGLIQGLGHPLTMVTPQKWKKAAGLIGTEQDRARRRPSCSGLSGESWMPRSKAAPLQTLP